MPYMQYVVICRTKHHDGSPSETFVFGPMDSENEAIDVADAQHLQALIDEDRWSYVVDEDGEVQTISRNWKAENIAGKSSVPMIGGPTAD